MLYVVGGLCGTVRCAATQRIVALPARRHEEASSPEAVAQLAAYRQYLAQLQASLQQPSPAGTPQLPGLQAAAAAQGRADAFGNIFRVSI